MPPLHEVLDALTHAVLPSAVAAAVVFAAVSRLPRQAAVAAGAVALAAGFAAGNHFRGAAEYRLDTDRPLTAADLTRAVHDTFVPPPADDLDAPGPPAARYWLPWTAGLALLAGLLARSVPPAVGWPVRVAAAAVAAAFAVPADLRASAPWLAPLLAVVILGGWATLERLGRDADGPSRRLVPPRRLIPIVAAAAAFAAASVVLLYAHSARFVDLATILAAALGGIAAAAWPLRADPSAAAPGVAVALPGLMLAGQQDTFSDVPAFAFALVAAAPLALAPLLAPRVRRLGPATAWLLAAALTALPLAAAVAAAVANESLSFG